MNANAMPAARDLDYGLTSTREVLSTSAAGDRLAPQPDVDFSPGRGEAASVVRVRPEIARQTLLGIGSSFTEASAFVLAHLEPARRFEVMRRIYGQQGANFSFARTPIGATDFCVDGKYSYAEVPGDTALAHFSVAPDRDGFSRGRHPGIRDESFDLLPMIREALAIKQAQQDRDLRIVASAWTAPPWMKDIDDWYRAGSGGSLKAEHQATYADYLVRYLDAYRAEGVHIWGLTPVNEPLGNDGSWESMHFSAESQRDFIKHHLGPKLAAGGHGDVELLMLDHARSDLEHWADVIYGDADCARYVSGAAVHWYESTFKVYADVFERVHARYPGYSIIHTEGCIDNLGNPAPDGVLDTDGYEESGWFGNDDFWWHDNATDWAYSATWNGVVAEDHPKYAPVHRYARDIIGCLNHWVAGWIDWNVVLDARGGPNHVGNYCGAPIMIDTASGRVYYTPVFHVLAQFSRTIRPGDRVVQTETRVGDADPGALHACATIDGTGLLSVQVLNVSPQPIEFALEIGAQHARVTVAANALQTIRCPLRAKNAIEHSGQYESHP